MPPPPRCQSMGAKLSGSERTRGSGTGRVGGGSGLPGGILHRRSVRSSSCSTRKRRMITWPDVIERAYSFVTRACASAQSDTGHKPPYSRCHSTGYVLATLPRLSSCIIARPCMRGMREAGRSSTRYASPYMLAHHPPSVGAHGNDAASRNCAQSGRRDSPILSCELVDLLGTELVVLCTLQWAELNA